MIIIIIIKIMISRSGHEIKLHPVVEFQRGIVRLPFVTTTSSSPLSKVYYLSALPEAFKFRVGVWRRLVCLLGREDPSALVGNPPSDGVTILIPVVVSPNHHYPHYECYVKYWNYQQRR